MYSLKDTKNDFIQQSGQKMILWNSSLKVTGRFVQQELQFYRDYFVRIKSIIKKQGCCELRKLLYLLVIISLLSGCSSELSFSEVSEKGVNKDLQSFIDNVNEENGVHLYLEKQKAVYVYLNGSNVKQGEKAIHFTDFNVEKKGETLRILYNTAETADYSNQSIKHELLYKVNLDKKYEIIEPIGNGEEASFGVISGYQ